MVPPPEQAPYLTLTDGTLCCFADADDSELFNLLEMSHAEPEQPYPPDAEGASALEAAQEEKAKPKAKRRPRKQQQAPLAQPPQPGLQQPRRPPEGKDTARDACWMESEIAYAHRALIQSFCFSFHD